MICRLTLVSAPAGYGKTTLVSNWLHKTDISAAWLSLDEGEPMAKLLYQAKSHRLGFGYAAELLAAMGTASGTELLSTQFLIEPLTARELEVLKLIEAGCSNQAIAEKLVISITTIKRHISNIYAKLDVTSRTQATSHARELGLFK
jgi:LuxR family maltose regulon positive regulatory protein